MSQHLNAVKEGINKIVELLLNGSDEAEKILELRLAFVGYRDFSDEVPFEILNFTESVEDFQVFCEKITADGGGDAAEDVFGGFSCLFEKNWLFLGIEKTFELEWNYENSGTKLIFHICDAPSHGKEYNNSDLTDNYPNGDPKGRTPEKILDFLNNLGILYHFGKINNTTNLMISKFETILKDPIITFNITNVESMI